jgi:chromosome segregation ATPase
MSELVQTVGALSAAIMALYLVIQKYLVTRAKDETVKTGESAFSEQFRVLQEALEANRKEAAEARRETAELRLEFSRMDKVIHAQQRTVTRMEMLLRQFSSLVQSHGIDVPIYMQAELEVLIVPSADIVGYDDRRKAA